jgi:poly-gamma-glutamate synthesis protein (capsule biosynthesis protein)
MNSPGILPWDDMKTISARIEEIKAKCRWCVIVCHGGEEFTCLPMPYTRDRYIQFLELGADVVIGHHPHVAENYELFDNNKMIFYSLGNFIFDTDYQRAHPYTDIGVLVKLHFTEHDVSFEAIGTKIIRGLEHIDITPLPDIFTNITESDYNLLYPLAAKGLIIDERRRMIYLKPEKYTECSPEDWMAHLLDKEYEEYADGIHMDMFKVTKWANMTDSGLWKKCSLEAVKHYILQQFEIPYPVEYR